MVAGGEEAGGAVREMKGGIKQLRSLLTAYFCCKGRREPTEASSRKDTYLLTPGKQLAFPPVITQTTSVDPTDPVCSGRGAAGKDAKLAEQHL